MSHQVRDMGILREEFGGASKASGINLMVPWKCFACLGLVQQKSFEFRMSISAGVSVEGVVSRYKSLDGEQNTRV
jgi:hypothetical protein